MMWTQDLRIRSVDKATGSEIHSWKTDLPPMAAEPNYDWEQIERRLADGSDDPVPLGFRPRISLTLYFKAGRMAGATGFDDLEDVLSDASDRANALELAVHRGGTELEPTWDWKRVFLVPGSMDIQPLEGKYVGLQVDMEFQATGRQPSLPKRDGASW
jgi:hypothetical protein